MSAKKTNTHCEAALHDRRRSPDMPRKKQAEKSWQARDVRSFDDCTLKVPGC